MSNSYPLTTCRDVVQFGVLIMFKGLQLLSVILCGLLLFLMSACTPVDNENFIETQSAEYLEGKQKMREGDVVGALNQFLRSIDKHSYAPESHLEAGIIYLRNEDEPILAIYHLNRYLEQKPEGREAALVEELILSAKKQFAASLPGNPYKQQVSRMELLETIAGLRRQMESINQENLELKQQLATLQQRLSGTQDTMREILTTSADTTHPTTAAVQDGGGVRAQPLVMNPQAQQQVQQLLPQAQAASNLPETYQVKSGDSLYAISMNFYGDAEHIQTIFQANRNILKSVDDLRPGQVLKLPR